MAVALLVGLAAVPPLLAAAAGGVAPVTMTHSTWSLIADGLFVGFGARLGSGCTSGHGVARISPHSLMADVATIGQHLGNPHPAEALPA